MSINRPMTPRCGTHSHDGEVHGGARRGDRIHTTNPHHESTPCAAGGEKCPRARDAPTGSRTITYLADGGEIRTRERRFHPHTLSRRVVPGSDSRQVATFHSDGLQIRPIVRPVTRQVAGSNWNLKWNPHFPRHVVAKASLATWSRAQRTRVPSPLSTTPLHTALEEIPLKDQCHMRGRKSP